MEPKSTLDKEATFIKSFEKIINKSPLKTQEAWKRNPNIYFVLDIPIIESGAQNMLPTKLKQEYVVLINKLKSRTL